MSLQAKIDAQRYAGKIVALVLRECAELVTEGNTPQEISHKALRLCMVNGVTPSTLGYKGFPSPICVSVNDGAVHGIPTARPFQEGDVVKLDFACKFGGYHADAAITVCVREPSRAALELIVTTHAALLAAILEVGPGVNTKKITQAIENTLKGTNCKAVHGLSGHGIGREMHESPPIHNYDYPGARYQRLRVGQTIAIEPIVALGTHETILEPDGWTIKTKGGALAAQFEHTVLVTEEGCEVLTAWIPEQEND